MTHLFFQDINVVGLNPQFFVIKTDLKIASMNKGKKQYLVEEVLMEIYADSKSEVSDLSEQSSSNEAQIQESSESKKRDKTSKEKTR